MLIYQLAWQRKFKFIESYYLAPVKTEKKNIPAPGLFFLKIPTPGPALAPVSSEISDFTPCAHAQSDILHIKYA